MSIIIIGRTLFTGKTCIHEKRMDSTNNFARKYIAKTKPTDGTVIIADDQFAGRGQQGRTWISEPGMNLTMSIIYDTSFLRASEQYILNMAAAVGVCRSLQGLSKEAACYIKWPNDIVLEERKVGGLLIENTVSGSFLRYSVIGIGINVNQTGFPKGAGNPISLKSVLGMALDLRTVLEEVCVCVEGEFIKVREGRFAEVRQDYLQRLWRRGKNVRFNREGKEFDAVLLGVDEEGKVDLSFEGEHRKFSYGEVRISV